MKEVYQGKHVDLSFVSKNSPCIHCGGTNKCYSLANGLSVCISKRKPAKDWQETEEENKDGHRYYARKTADTTKKNNKNSSQDMINNQANLETVDTTGLPDVEITSSQKALDALFSDTQYIAIQERLYKWNKNHYKPCSEAREVRRITNWCSSTPVKMSNGRWKYAYATPGVIDTIWRYALKFFAIDPEEINQGGINCLNGVLEIGWEGITPIYNLVPHDPDKHFYTQVTEVEYDPFCDQTDCDRMLQALRPEQQTIWLRTIAASLALNKVRSRHSRDIRALLCEGTGSNGKDTLREAVSILFGNTMSSACLADFKQYDDGRKFPLAKLEGSKINWSSENSQYMSLDGLQSLKAAITGDPIDIEGKRANEYTISPESIFLFNVNEAPLLEAGSEAIQSRWSILSFKKTFVKGADSTQGQLEADGRFKYDANFMRKAVAPALLNKILVELENVMRFGIDHSSGDQAMESLQRESNHLWDFSQQIGIVANTHEKIYIKDLWERLQAWYEETGTLEILSDGRKIWNEQARSSDRNIKAPNQIYKRFKQIFSNIEKQQCTDRSNPSRIGQQYLSGISVKANVEATLRLQPLKNQHVEAVEAKRVSLAQLKMDMEKITIDERLELMGFLQDLNHSKVKGGQTASTASTSPPVGDTASTLPQHSRHVTSENSNNSNGESEASNASLPLNFTVNNHVSVETQLENKPDVENINLENHINEHPKIEWVKKGEKKYLIDRQEGLRLIGHESGIQKKECFYLDQCEEVHYKDEQKQTTLSTE